VINTIHVEDRLGYFMLTIFIEQQLWPVMSNCR
jgi:hypothetical protein